ncbi:hypothetical protein BCR34DRAFT_588563 [Clohesyomyces aquaticus]|uniref:WD40-repeat-containing domain protein n=1 Tax=Clohesyomyces aquaticus TaxID=1231657 RepID=A0A1Y1ZJS0_9PLEO|nr:hypothetical protein BCR34DRAFT_588563 [Clohesyomyces aquaticus]
MYHGDDSFRAFSTILDSSSQGIETDTYSGIGSCYFIMSDNCYYTASVGGTYQTQLEEHRGWLSALRRQSFTSIALSPNGWVGTATANEVQLSCLEGKNLTRNVGVDVRVRVEPLLKGDSAETIRDIALSHNICAIVTHRRVIVYEYGRGTIEEEQPLFHQVIDEERNWTPRSVSICQRTEVRRGNEISAWIAVGGEGVKGVRIFQCSYHAGWNVRSMAMVLRCPRNSGLIKSAGFTPPNTNFLMVFGLSTTNQIWSWNLGRRVYEESANHELNAFWYFDGSSGKSELQHRGHITSCSFVISPSKSLYIFCTVNQSHGSQMERSFLVPISPFSRRTKVPIGREILCGSVTSTGSLCVAVDRDQMSLVQLKEGSGAELASVELLRSWESPLTKTSPECPGISVMIREYEGRLEVTAVDRKGHIVRVDVHVRGLRAPQPPLEFGPSASTRVSEVEARPPSQIISELSSDGAICGSGSSTSS